MPSSISNSCSTKLQQPILALCLEKTSAFRFNTTQSESSSLSDILLFKCYISGRTGLFAANSVFVGLSGKFEQLDSPSSVSDFIEDNFLGHFNALIPFAFLVGMQGTLSYVKSFKVLHTLIVGVQRQRVSKLLSSLYRHRGCLCVQQNTNTQSALNE